MALSKTTLCSEKHYSPCRTAVLCFQWTPVMLWNTSNIKHLFTYIFQILPKKKNMKKWAADQTTRHQRAVWHCVFNWKNTEKKKCKPVRNLDSQGRVESCLVFIAGIWGFTMQHCHCWGSCECCRWEGCDLRQVESHKIGLYTVYREKWEGGREIEGDTICPLNPPLAFPSYVAESCTSSVRSKWLFRRLIQLKLSASSAKTCTKTN